MQILTVDMASKISDADLGSGRRSPGTLLGTSRGSRHCAPPVRFRSASLTERLPATDARVSFCEPEEGQCPRCCLTALVDVDRRRPCPASTLVDRRETRVTDIPPIHPKLRRSS